MLAFGFWIIRQYAIPNPFDVLGEGLTITIGSAPVVLSPDLLNWLADPALFLITYGVVGLYYQSGSEPVLGSFLYMLFYCLHMVGIYLLSMLYPVKWMMVLVIVAYILVHFMLYRLISE